MERTTPRDVNFDVLDRVWIGMCVSPCSGPLVLSGSLMVFSKELSISPMPPTHLDGIQMNVFAWLPHCSHAS